MITVITLSVKAGTGGFAGQVICFLADKTERWAWNHPPFKMFADPFDTAGLVIDSKMPAGFETRPERAAAAAAKT